MTKARLKGHNKETERKIKQAYK